MNDYSGRELLSPLAFGASFEGLANFLIDNVVDAEPTRGLGRFWILDLHNTKPSPRIPLQHGIPRTCCKHFSASAPCIFRESVRELHQRLDFAT
jgi:hypothetical protein